MCCCIRERKEKGKKKEEEAGSSFSILLRRIPDRQAGSTLSLPSLQSAFPPCPFYTHFLHFCTRARTHARTCTPCILSWNRLGFGVGDTTFFPEEKKNFSIISKLFSNYKTLSPALFVPEKLQTALSVSISLLCVAFVALCAFFFLFLFQNSGMKNISKHINEAVEEHWLGDKAIKEKLLLISPLSLKHCALLFLHQTPPRLQPSTSHMTANLYIICEKKKKASRKLCHKLHKQNCLIAYMAYMSLKRSILLCGCACVYLFFLF